MAWDTHKTTAAAAVVYTVFTAVIMGGTLYQSRLIAKNNVISERAFIGVSSPLFSIGKDENDATKQTAGATILVTNSGNTPTQNYTGFARCAPWHEKLSEPWSLLMRGDQKAVPNFVVPHGITNLNCAFSMDDMTAIASGGTYGYIMGEVNYRDRIDPTIPHVTQFEWIITHAEIFPPPVPGAVPGLIVQGRVIGAHNCADEECPKD